MLLQKHEYQAIIRLKQAPDPYRRLVVSIRCEWLSAKDKMPDTLCCILFKNYIKPQLTVLFELFCLVVSYLKTTSNHNIVQTIIKNEFVVSYLKTTSNHN